MREIAPPALRKDVQDTYLLFGATPPRDSERRLKRQSVSQSLIGIAAVVWIHYAFQMRTERPLYPDLCTFDPFHGNQHSVRQEKKEKEERDRMAAGRLSWPTFFVCY